MEVVNKKEQKKLKAEQGDIVEIYGIVCIVTDEESYPVLEIKTGDLHGEDMGYGKSFYDGLYIVIAKRDSTQLEIKDLEN